MPDSTLDDAVLEGGRVGSMCALRCAMIKCDATGFALPFGGLYGNTRESPLRVPRTPGEVAFQIRKLDVMISVQKRATHSVCMFIDVIQKAWCQIHNNN